MTAHPLIAADGGANHLAQLGLRDVDRHTYPRLAWIAVGVGHDQEALGGEGVCRIHLCAFAAGEKPARIVTGAAKADAIGISESCLFCRIAAMAALGQPFEPPRPHGIDPLGWDRGQSMSSYGHGSPGPGPGPGEPGMTASLQLVSPEGHRGVVALDMLLRDVSAVLPLLQTSAAPAAAIEAPANPWVLFDVPPAAE